MSPRVRPAARSAARLARLLPALALAAAPPVHANVSGSLELQSHTTQTFSQPASSAPSTLLVESLSLNYAGLPLGPAVAIATAGGSVSNSTGWMGEGPRTDAQIYTVGGSLGLLPRRAVPLRLYGSGSFTEGTSGVLATSAPGPTLLYGAAVNLEPGTLPGLRLDVSEGRSSRPGFGDLADVQRRLAGQTWGTVARQRVDLAVRLDTDHREGGGDVTARSATLNVRSAPHQTVVVASDVRRFFPTLAGITSDRHLGATSDQRWTPWLSSQLGARLSEAGAPGATGTLGDARAGVTWVPLRGGQQLTLSGTGSAGFARTSAEAVAGSGRTVGGGARVGYSRAFGQVTGGLSAGGAVDTFRSDEADCAVVDPGTGLERPCGLGNEGTTTQVNGTFSLSASPRGRAQAQAEYTIARAFAPLGRGGDRTEHRVRGTGRLEVGARGSVHAGLSYDDGVRELVDITAARATSQRERTVGASLGATTAVEDVALSVDGRYTHGRVVTEGVELVAGPLRQVRSVMTAQGSASWAPARTLSLHAQLGGAWTELADAPSISSVTGNLGVSWRLGRLVLSGEYQALRVQLAGSDPIFQHSIRTVLSRPFEL